MKNTLLLTGVLAICTATLQAQTAFDPMLDPNAKVVTPVEQESWNSTYMWYPGLLSAHMQRVQKAASYERCVNVNYPGNFLKDSNESYFRKTVRLSKDTDISWAAPANLTLTVDGQAVNTSQNKYTLKRGTHTLLFHIATDGPLPAIILKGEGVEGTAGWQVSLDGQTWNMPETDPRFCHPATLPDSPQEITVQYFPTTYNFFRNCEKKSDGTLALGREGKLIVDFHHLEIGYVVFKAKGQGKLYVSVGESPEEVIDEQTVRELPRGAQSDDGLGEAKSYLYEQKKIDPIELTSTEKEYRMPLMAVRFMELESEWGATISDIRFDAQVWPVDFLMQFNSDNENVNQLWKASVATLHTSMHNFYLDGVKRDFLPWSMDAIVSSLGGDYLFGDRQVARNGLSIALMPPHPSKADWGIVDYPLHALIGLKHDYLRYGDINTSLMFRDRIEQQLALYESVQDERGFISSERPQSGFIPGWSRDMGPDSYGTPCYPQIMLYENFRIAAYFYRLWKEPKRAAYYDQKAEFLQKNIFDHFWDTTQKAFINGYRSDGSRDERISHHAQYWSVITGLYPERLLDYLYETVIPSIPYYKENVSYEKGYEMLAYIKAGRFNEMFSLLDEVWGDWLRQGGTRFPENFMPQQPLKKQLEFSDRPFGLSLCHGANGVPGVVAVLNGIFGFCQNDQKPNEYTLRPTLWQMTHAEGRIPVKEGFIEVNFQKNGTSSVTIPAGCTVKVVMNGKVQTLKKAGKHFLN